MFGPGNHVAVSEAGIVRAVPGGPDNQYELAATLYESLYRCRPAAGQSRETSATFLPEGVWDVLQQALLKAGPSRFANCVEFASRIALEAEASLAIHDRPRELLCAAPC